MLNYKIKVWHMSIWRGRGEVRLKRIVQLRGWEMRDGGTALVKALCKLCAHAVLVVAGYFQIVECMRVIASF